MDKQQVLDALGKIEQASRKRGFNQSIEMMVNFKSLDYKKADNQVDLRVKVPYPTKKGSGKTLLFAKTPEFAAQAKGKIESVVMDDKIASLSKKDVVGILNDFDLLLAEGQAMLTVAKHLGQQLAPRGKMPKLVQPTISSVEESLLY